MTGKVLRGSFGAIQEQSIQAKETRPRQEELAGRANQSISRNLPRHTTRPGKARQATSFQTRQGTDRGKALAAASYHSVPALQHIYQRVALGPFQARVAASDADKTAIVASGGVPDGPFYTIWAMQTGI